MDAARRSAANAVILRPRTSLGSVGLRSRKDWSIARRAIDGRYVLANQQYERLHSLSRTGEHGISGNKAGYLRPTSAPIRTRFIV
jgi:hypothetical protein